MGDSRASVVVFYIGVAGFAMGIFVRSLVSAGLPEVLWLLLLALGLMVVWRVRGRASHSVLLFLAVLFTGIALGVVRLEIATWGELVPEFESRLGLVAVVEGVIVLEPDQRCSQRAPRYE